jgi:TRAP-type C4-dicarboxylate transport system permease small subunit
MKRLETIGAWLFGAVFVILSFALALVARAHIRIDLVHERLPRGLRIVLNLAAVASLAVTAGLLSILAWFALSDSIAMNSTAQTPWATPLR